LGASRDSGKRVGLESTFPFRYRSDVKIRETRPIRWQGKDGSYIVTLRFAPIEGRMECVGVDVEAVPGGAVTAVALHSIPLGKLIAKRQSEAGNAIASPATIAVTTSIPQPTVLTTRRGGRPPKYDRAWWEKVARVYVEAYARNRTPTRAVASRFRVSESAAAKWVAKCRDIGLLPKTTRGKARAVVERSTAGVKATAGIKTSGEVLKRGKKR
jgi:hypothetical protein